MRRYVRGHRTVVASVIAASAVALTAATIAMVPTANAATGGGAPDGAIKASSFNAQSGAKVENTADTGGGKNVGWLANGDWLRYDGVDLGQAGNLTTSARVAAAYKGRPGAVEVRLDSVTGQLVAAIPITATGGWQSWTTKTDQQPSPGGKHDVFLVMRSDQPADFVNINWFAFGGAASGGVDGTPSGSAMPSPSMKATGAATGTPAPAGGWLPVDPAKWNAQLAAFQAMTPRAIPANPRKNAEFNATCTFSHAASDDPIVFPGNSGASHNHTFLGNDSTDANTTAGDLMKLTASSCQPLEDHSAYWVPTLYEHDQLVKPKQVIVYYGSLLADKTKTVPMPQGMRMIAGDGKLQKPTPVGAVNQFYCAGGPQDGKERSTDGNWPVCDGGTLHFTLRFPDCWDGKNLDSPNHKGHVSFGQAGKCPSEFPVAIPAVTFSIAYPTAGTKDGFKLSSGMASSMHGDAFFAWEDEAMGHRVKDCVVQVIQCNTAGQF